VSASSELLVRRFYDELWNDWRLHLVDELLSENIRFRGSLGSVCEGRAAFRDYVRRVRDAFPDWHNQIDELFSTGDRAAARLTWTGTHAGEFLGIPPTGRRVSYVGAALFRVAGGRIADAWVVGDTQRLWQAIGQPPESLDPIA
jgi:steroid delta-isomerase-like uncharacterized protein